MNTNKQKNLRGEKLHTELFLIISINVLYLNKKKSV